MLDEHGSTRLLSTAGAQTASPTPTRSRFPIERSAWQEQGFRYASARVDDRVGLRAFRENDLPFLDRLCTDPEALGVFEWPGFVDVRARRRRWEKDGYIGEESTALAVVLPDGTVAGLASWRAQHRGGSPGACYEIGLALLPEHRGRGLGTAAQRLLVHHLFSYTTVHRLEALTNTKNIAEQKVLERLGFQREGILRGIVFGNGAWQDNMIYSLLRHEAPGHLR